MTANFHDALAALAADADRPCIITPDETLSYGELYRGAARLAALLLAKGVAPGDRIAVQAPKSVEALMLYLATLQAGGVYVPLNHGYTEAEIAYFLDDARPKLFVRDVAALVHEAAVLEPMQGAIVRSGEDPAAIIYTSGTTGRSKGAILSHRALEENARALIAAWGFTRDDVLLHALPIFHVHGLFISLHTALLSGAALYWLEKFEEAPVRAGLARSSVMMGVPTFYTRLLADPEFSRADCEGVRLFVSGSAPLLESTFRAFIDRTGMTILERYGMSETIIITSNPLDGDRVAGSVGYALPGISVRLDPAGGVEVKGPSLLSGYWQMPEKTAESFTPDGWFITGDIGRLDPDGRLWLIGRAKDLIISGGYNVYPSEIEQVLDALPGVTESAVIGVPHADFGEAVFAVATGQGDPATILAAAREQLAGYKTPKQLIFVDALPRNAMGKVEKQKLRDAWKGIFAA